MRKSTNILTMISAVATGVVLGILFAPNKGTSTRKELSKKSQEYADYASKSFEKIADTITSTLKDVKIDTINLANKAKTKAKEAIDDSK